MSRYTAFSEGPEHPCPLYTSNLAAHGEMRFPRAGDRSLVHESVRNGNLSACQLDAVAMARARHDQDLPFLISDGTGVGKGRQAVGVILNNMAIDKTTRAMFVSVANVFPDLLRDVEALGFSGKVVDIRKGALPAKGLVFVAYGSFAKRAKDLANWLGSDTNNTAVFDEFHSARGLEGKGTAVANAVADFVEKHPSRLLFMTASPADSLKSFRYLMPLFGGDVQGFDELREKFGNRNGAAILELLFHELAARNAVISRTIGFDGVRCETIQVEPTRAELDAMHEASLIWNDLFAMEWPNSAKGQLNGAAQRFGLAQILLTKVNATVERAKRALDEGDQVVISLISTGESAAGEAMANAEDGEAGAAAGIALSMKQAIDLAVECGLVDSTEESKLRDRVTALGLTVASPLSVLKQKLGGTEAVAELTGRKVFYHFDVETGWTAEKRSSDVTKERADFQAGVKRVAILSAACGTGTSLHSCGDGAAKRTQILFQLPWSSTTALQMFGRTHRAGQASPPTYVIMESSLGPDRRVGAAVSARLASLGAISTGDRGSTGGVTVDSAEVSGDRLIEFATQGANALLSEPEELKETIDRMGLPSHVNKGTQFINRLLVCSPWDANSVFEAFACKAEEAASEAERRGTLAPRVITLESPRARVESETSLHMGGSMVEIKHDRSMTHAQACDKRDQMRAAGNNVYFSDYGGGSLVWHRTKTTCIAWTSRGDEVVEIGQHKIPKPASVSASTWDRVSREAVVETMFVAKLPALCIFKSGLGRICDVKIVKVSIDGDRFLGVGVSKYSAEYIIGENERAAAEAEEQPDIRSYDDGTISDEEEEIEYEEEEIEYEEEEIEYEEEEIEEEEESYEKPCGLDPEQVSIDTPSRGVKLGSSPEAHTKVSDCSSGSDDDFVSDMENSSHPETESTVDVRGEGGDSPKRSAESPLPPPPPKKLKASTLFNYFQKIA